jgi:hypothetical protein
MRIATPPHFFHIYLCAAPQEPQKPLGAACVTSANPGRVNLNAVYRQHVVHNTVVVPGGSALSCLAICGCGCGFAIALEADAPKLLVPPTEPPALPALANTRVVSALALCSAAAPAADSCSSSLSSAFKKSTASTRRVSALGAAGAASAHGTLSSLITSVRWSMTFG